MSPRRNTRIPGSTFPHPAPVVFAADVTTLGVLSIGQSPRTELVDDLRRLLPAGQEIVDAGVLDGLDRYELDALAPGPDDVEVLTTRLPDGRTAVFAAHEIESRLPAAVAGLEARVDVVLLACTGEFSGVVPTRPLLTPDHLLTAAVVGLGARAAAVGVICPLPQQVGTTRAKFAGHGLDLRVAACSPYTGTDAELAAVASGLADDGAELLVLDCMGFTDAHRRAVRGCGVPVVVARSVVARLVAELLV